MATTTEPSSQPIRPTVSIVTPTYNSAAGLSRLLSSIEDQDYPHDAIEIIVVDGGSTDDTIKIAESHGARIINERSGRPEMATAIGYGSATKDLIINLPSDNVLPHQNWISQMVEPFTENENIVAAQTLRYSYSKNANVLDRYFAIFGSGDPFAYYLGKRDRISWLEKKWTLPGVATDRGRYFLVEFHKDRIPTLGANGYLVRRRIIQEFLRDPADFFHVDSNFDLIASGHNTFAIVKNDILHLSGESFFKYFPKRLRYMRIYFHDKNRRRYHLYNPDTDKRALAKFVLLSSTFVLPLTQSIRAYKTSRDFACMIHPLFSFLTLMFYGFGAISQSSVKNDEVE